MSSNLARQKLACIIILTGFFLVVLLVIFLWNGFVLTRGNHGNQGTIVLNHHGNQATTIVLSSNVELSSADLSRPEQHLYDVSAAQSYGEFDLF